MLVFTRDSPKGKEILTISTQEDALVTELRPEGSNRSPKRSETPLESGEAGFEARQLDALVQTYTAMGFVAEQAGVSSEPLYVVRADLGVLGMDTANRVSAMCLAFQDKLPSYKQGSRYVFRHEDRVVTFATGMNGSTTVSSQLTDAEQLPWVIAFVSAVAGRRCDFFAKDGSKGVLDGPLRAQIEALDMPLAVSNVLKHMGLKGSVVDLERLGASPAVTAGLSLMM